MDNIGTYETYSTELTEINPLFTDLKQLTVTSSDPNISIITENFSMDLSQYTDKSSLLVSLESGYFCNFNNGKPASLS